MTSVIDRAEEAFRELCSRHQAINMAVLLPEFLEIFKAKSQSTQSGPGLYCVAYMHEQRRLLRKVEIYDENHTLLVSRAFRKADRPSARALLYLLLHPNQACGWKNMAAFADTGTFPCGLSDTVCQLGKLPGLSKHGHGQESRYQLNMSKVVAKPL